ncbi:TPA: MptD family putative ECF transporter S component [Streptococcus pyogenes]|uniref:MptD family putative ECF transporter S component n=1 Tax=Streptococcus pyogenes TaxID=1314 RepID=UPI0010A0E3A2|nr:MptD family putative ECF transporter S component [Streptococcus pyogenes]VHE60225.1 ABC transporter permease [Streptococcus pyogenes]VHF21620.1 ABC transporter permease [Streptococcus pyogenes]HEP1493136.1 MptD family putative ECF transporter S component [Streptococcus pyogenes]HEP2112881.1 MptD family putative ECF transporter S component [Streptococcus pyogenes]HEP2146381.1 MptD family putative ECF transporter S component [Streptococcus pyogenes]
METNKKTNKLNAKDFIFIGIFGAVALLIFFVTGALAALTLFGTVANIPITLFFVSIAFMLLVSKVRKTGVFLIMGTIIVLPGFMAANGIGVGLSILGWPIAEIVASKMKYKNKKAIVIPYVIGSTLQSALFTLPMYISHGEYFIQRKEILHLTDEALQQYLKFMGSWGMYGSMVALTVLTSLIGALISMRILKKHFEKAGVI